MNEDSIKKALLQGKTGACEPLLREYMRIQIRESLWDLMQEEVSLLCGPKYQSGPGCEYRRGGSEQGVVYIGGKRQRVVRPRVRQRGADGLEREVGLRTYAGARRARRVEAEVAECVAQGMSTRSFARLKLDGLSPSEVSRQWVASSVARIADLRGRDLSQESFFGIILDGVFLAREITVLVAVGLLADGRKMVLDFEVGSSESYEVSRTLLARITARGFRVAGRLFALVDGSAALEKAILERWSDAAIQRCLVHKERNLHAQLRRKDHGECCRLMNRLRQAQGAEAGREALQELQDFLAPRNQEALQSLREAGDKLISLHLLGVPSTLNRSLLSTNLIENVMLNYRRQTSRVCRWQTQTDQVPRWTASALLWAEQGFRKISGHKDLSALLAALGFPPAPPSRIEPTALQPGRDTPARGAPASCHTPCSPPGDSQPVGFPASVLPQQEGGAKTDAFTRTTTAEQT